MNSKENHSHHHNVNYSRNNRHHEMRSSECYKNHDFNMYNDNVNHMKHCPNEYNSCCNETKYNHHDCNHSHNTTDYGPKPFVININEATKQNNNFRTALWTGCHLQLTLMSINVGEDIGLEMHDDLDQFIRIEEGQGIVRMGNRKDRLDFQSNVSDDFAIIIPAGTWHNLINTGCKPLKLYSIYAPTQHPKGTIHKTKEDAEEA